jgi:transcriptional regulator with XRE-family HTH domain
VETSQKFAERLRTRRNRLNLSQGELAELAGVSPRSIFAWENGQNLPTTNKLHQLSAALSCRQDWLLGNVDDPALDDSGNESPVAAKCRDYLEQFLKKCGADESRQHWTLIQLQKNLPLNYWDDLQPTSDAPESAAPDQSVDQVATQAARAAIGSLKDK